MQQHLQAARIIATDHRASQWLQAADDRSARAERGHGTDTTARYGLSQSRTPFAHRVARLFVGRAAV